MIDQLVQLVRNYATDAVVANPAVPNEQNEAVIGEATNSITSVLQNALANGQAKDVLALFNGGGADVAANPLVNGISGNFITNIMQKFNISPEAATSIAGSLIPTVMNSMVKKTNDPNDKGFDLTSILSSLTGGNVAGLNVQGMLGKLGLDKDGDGDVDFQDFASMLSKGAKQQQQGGEQKSEGGGLGDLLGGFFGK
ncbi:hypothetical protein LX64_02815 [Chitinophaga skermanii]|uniref:EF-hand domain-containing protein n=1 Tax=Chitinophaga skermanii TaxID=331697 RepID=A0A327QIY3_9BACT|nr:hypothetical protein [Chitinophaga skermanii]RAJ03938.1 hypothetical protein LX64_02815 [Chitinophaga skermanii]